jgi:hypothetical protein
MDTSASIIKAMLPEAAQKLLGDGDTGALNQPRTAEGNADRVTGDSPSDVLRVSPQVCETFGRKLGGIIVIVALLVCGRGRGRGMLLLGVSIGLLGAFKLLGHF